MFRTIKRLIHGVSKYAHLSLITLQSKQVSIKLSVLVKHMQLM